MSDVTTKLVDDDYALVDGTAWFRVGSFNVNVHATSDGVFAEIYALGDENSDAAVASAYASDADADDTNAR